MTHYFGNGMFGDKDGNIEIVRKLEQYEFFTQADFHVWRNVDCKVPLREVVKEWTSSLAAKDEHKLLSRQNDNGKLEIFFQIF
jgi:hypothetical protein